MALEYQEFKTLVSELLGVDLSQYKNQQMDRRINSMIQSWNAGGYEDVLRLLQTDPHRFAEFEKRLTINVTEFFRNPDRFEDLRQRIMPELLAKHKNLKIWSAGCSDGPEPYSVALIVRELRAEERVNILATDIDQAILKKAHHAVYVPNQLRHLPKELVVRYFIEQSNGNFVLNREIVEMVDFRRHDLLLDEFEHDMDLIICRNVIIYFTEQAKSVLYEKFRTALKPGGILMVGGTEPILHYRQLDLESHGTSFYRLPEQPKKETY
jgi:chemotaxis protein methyltransferase CheR